MVRLFTALKIPAEICDELHKMQYGIEGANWMPPENFHITLSFIGNVEDEWLSKVKTVLKCVECPTFELSLKGCGIFEQKAVKSHLWAGISRNKILQELKKQIDLSFDEIDLPYVKRDYVPHLTLAQIRHACPFDIKHYLARYLDVYSKKFLIENFTLFQSHMSQKGSIFEEIKSFSLKGASQNRIDTVHS